MRTPPAALPGEDGPLPCRVMWGPRALGGLDWRRSFIPLIIMENPRGTGIDTVGFTEEVSWKSINN